MGGLLRTWWPICLLVYVPSLVRAVSRILFLRGIRRLDLSNPDDLPHTAGDWLVLEIERLGLSGKLRTIVTDDERHSIDAYHPLVGVIQLTADTHFKRDPVQWGVAAHELGHAQFQLGWPILGRAIIFSAFVRQTLVALGLGVAFGNVLYAQPGATAFAFDCLAVAAALQALQLLDEAMASVIGMRSLRNTPTLGPRQLRASRNALLLAFMTYVLSAVSRALLLTQWHLVERVTAVPLVPPTATLTTVGVIGAIAATIVLALFAFIAVAAAKKPKLPITRLIMIAWQLALLGFVWLVWNHSAEPSYARWAMLAIVQLVELLSVVIVLPMVIVDLVLLDRITRRLAVGGAHETAELVRDRQAGRELRRAGNAAFDRLVETARATPMIEQRLRFIAWLSYVPLVIAFWSR